MDSETALLHQFQSFADQDIPVMEMEIVSKKLHPLLPHQFAQLVNTVMEKETVFQIQ